MHCAVRASNFPLWNSVEGRPGFIAVGDVKRNAAITESFQALGSGASAGSNRFRHFPAQRPGRYAWTFPSSGSSREVKLLARQPASLMMCPLPSTKWQSGPCGPPFWPLRALPPTPDGRVSIEDQPQNAGLKIIWEWTRPWQRTAKVSKLTKCRIAPILWRLALRAVS